MTASRRLGRARCLTTALALALPAAACAQRPASATAARAAEPVLARADTAALHRTLDSLADAHRGVVGYTILNLDTGERLSRRGDEPFPTASLIKVPILVTVHRLVAQDSLSLDDPVTMLALDQVGGAGTLQFMRTPLTLRVGDLAWLMTTISDNTATNLLLDRITVHRVWHTMEALGLPRTKVHGRSMMVEFRVSADSGRKYGLGVSTPDEMAGLFARLARGQAVSPAADSAMLDVLAHNEDDRKLRRYTGGIRAAGKTGDVNASRTDCTLWWLQSRVVACVFTRENADQSWRLDNEAQLLMANMGRAITGAWPKRGEGR